MGFLFSLIVYFVLLVLAVSLNVATGLVALDNVGYFLDPASLLFVLVPALAFTLAAVPAGALRLGIVGAFSPPAVGRDGPAAQEALRFLGDMALLLGVVGTLIGIVLLLQTASDSSRIGPALAVALLTYVYGFGLRLLCRAGARRIAVHVRTHH